MQPFYNEFFFRMYPVIIGNGRSLQSESIIGGYHVPKGVATISDLKMYLSLISSDSVLDSRYFSTPSCKQFYWVFWHSRKIYSWKMVEIRGQSNRRKKVSERFEKDSSFRIFTIWLRPTILFGKKICRSRVADIVG